MTEGITCRDAREAAAEFALGILPGDERARVAAHILRCPECRTDVEEYGQIGAELLELIPDAEPPLGFDRRVLAAVSPRKRRPGRIAAGAAAAAAAVAGLVLGLTLGSGGGPHTVTAALLADGHSIGSVYVEGRPPWVWMSVYESGLSGRVTCDLVEDNGRQVPLGSFDLVHGNGTWGAPEPTGVEVYGARLVAPDGQVIATATF